MSDMSEILVAGRHSLHGVKALQCTLLCVFLCVYVCMYVCQ